MADQLTEQLTDQLTEQLTDQLTGSITDTREFFAWLRSPAGGRHMVRDRDEDNYALIYYDKKVTNMKGPLTRSMLWSKVEAKAIYHSPPRSSPIEELADDLTNYVVEEFVDGVMINMFYDRIQSKWRLATRTQLDANCMFYGNRTFSELFWEACDTHGIKRDILDKNATYSWVLQHPDERVVVSPTFGVPRLALVQYTGMLPDALVPFTPIRSNIASLATLQEYVANQGRRLGSQWQGVVIKHVATHKRYRIRTRQYEEARDLRGNQAKRPYLWLERWSQGRLSAYLQLYPEERCDADTVIAAFKSITQQTHDYYMRVYRKKEMPLGKVPHKFRKILWDAHKANAGAYFANLRKFMNEQDTARKLWLVNYDTRYPEESVPVPVPGPVPDPECMEALD